ncbi:MAG: PaaI family thioesterase [Pseudomonadota bacterium]
MAKIYEGQRSPSAELMGSEFVSFDADKGELTTRFTPPPSFASPRGAVQGGLIAGFLDEVMGGALLAATEGSEHGQKLPLNLDMKLSFMRMVPLGPIIAKGRVVKVGRRVAFLEGELYDEAGKLLATATSTAIPTDLPA